MAAWPGFATWLEMRSQNQDGWKSIDRRATPRDLLLRQTWQMKEAEVVAACQARAAELRLVGIKIISAEYSFDGSRLTILFSTETEEKYDLKTLRQDMQKLYASSQVEMHQIGPRDVAKVLCGMGACGMETRCCCLFLTEFSSISIRMAKEQGISLTPSEITGMCGRLRCCLIYEYDTYVDARAHLPKRNKQVRTPQGIGKVVDIAPLRGSVIVEIPEVGQKEFKGEEVFAVDEKEPSAGRLTTSVDVPVPGNEQISDGENGGSSLARPPASRPDVNRGISRNDTATGATASKPSGSRRSDRTGRRLAHKNPVTEENKDTQQPAQESQPIAGRRPGSRWKKKLVESGHLSEQNQSNRQNSAGDSGQQPAENKIRIKKGPRNDVNDNNA